MITIRINQSRFFFNKKKEIAIPENWSECSLELAAFALRMLSQMPAEDAHIRIAARFIGVSDDKFAKLPLAVVNQTIDLIKWMDLSPINYPIFQAFHWQGKHYLAPAQGLTTITGIEFVFALEYYNSLIGGNDDALRMLAATLYHPKDDRIKSRSDVVARAQEFEHLPVQFLLAIYLQVSGSIMFMTDKFKPHVFPDKNDTPGKKATGGWFGWLMDIAHDGVFGPYEKVCLTNIYLLFIWRTKQGQRIAQQKKMYERNK